MSDTPRACPNMGVDCDFPDCTFLDAECAAANAEAPTVNKEPQGVHRPPAERTLFPITADDIFKGQ